MSRFTHDLFSGASDPMVANSKGSVFFQSPAGFESGGGGAYLAYNIPSSSHAANETIVNLSSSPNREGGDYPPTTSYNNHAGAMVSSPFNGAAALAEAGLKFAAAPTATALDVPLPSAVTVTTTSRTQRSGSRDTSPPSSLAPESEDDETATFSAALVRHAARELGVDYVPSTGTLPSYRNKDPQDPRSASTWSARHQSIHQTRRILQNHTDVTFDDEDIDPLGGAPLSDDPWQGEHYLIGMSPDFRFLVSGGAGDAPFINSAELERQIELREKALGPKHLSIASLRLQLAEHYFACANNRRYALRNADAIAANGSSMGTGLEGAEQAVSGSRAARLAEAQLMSVVDIFSERFGGPLAAELVPVYSKLGSFYMASKRYSKASEAFDNAKKCAERCAHEEKEKEEFRMAFNAHPAAGQTIVRNADGSINKTYQSASTSASQLANNKLRTLLGALRADPSLASLSPPREGRRGSITGKLEANATDEVAKALARTAVAQYMTNGQDGSVVDISHISKDNASTVAGEGDESSNIRGPPMSLSEADKALLKNPLYSHENLTSLISNAENSIRGVNNRSPQPQKPHITTSTQMVLDQAIATANRLREQRLQEEARIAEEIKHSIATQKSEPPNKNPSSSPVRIRFQFPNDTSGAPEQLAAHVGTVMDSIGRAGLVKEEEVMASSNSRSSTPFSQPLPTIRLSQAPNNRHPNITSSASYDLDPDEHSTHQQPNGSGRYSVVVGSSYRLQQPKGHPLSTTPSVSISEATPDTKGMALQHRQEGGAGAREGSVMLEIASLLLKQSQQIV